MLFTLSAVGCAPEKKVEWPDSEKTYTQSFLRSEMDNTNGEKAGFCQQYGEFRKAKSLSDVPEVWQFFPNGTVQACEIIARSGVAKPACITNGHRTEKSHIEYDDVNHVHRGFDVQFIGNSVVLGRSSSVRDMDSLDEIDPANADKARTVIESCGP